MEISLIFWFNGMPFMDDFGHFFGKVFEAFFQLLRLFILNPLKK